MKKGKLWLRTTIQNAGTALSEDNMYGEAGKTGGKYLCRLIMATEKISAELIKTAGKSHSIFKRRLTHSAALMAGGEELRAGLCQRNTKRKPIVEQGLQLSHLVQF
ncbi:MAG TPA: hypothetical protein VMW23_06400 [Sedimentisphaerales bacterium]|nr:hypothetical protein [Sedimentisphaerales bacterium]